jgi:hypothetical protein
MSFLCCVEGLKLGPAKTGRAYGFEARKLLGLILLRLGLRLSERTADPSPKTGLGMTTVGVSGDGSRRCKGFDAKWFRRLHGSFTKVRPLCMGRG